MTSLAAENGASMNNTQNPVLSSSPSFSPTPTARLLVVDDESTIRLVLAKYLRTRGFDVESAESGEAALEVLGGGGRRFDIMLCDVRMPGLSGVEIIPSALEIDPDLGIVMLSAVNDAPTATDAMAQGVLDYLIKPIELDQLYDAVNRALHRRTLLREQRRVEWAIREEVASRTEELEREKAHLRDLAIGVVDSLVIAMEAKDVFQRGRSVRISEIAASIAEFLGLAPDVVEDVRIAGRVHDVGNIGIREDVLNKPAALDPEEFEHVKDHVQIGVEILRPLRHIERAVVFVSEHHERWDGTGYPHARKGDSISIGARILAAADAFDAMTSRRAYRDALTPEEAVLELRNHAGTLLDPQVYEALRVVVLRRKSLVFVDHVHG